MREIKFAIGLARENGEIFIKILQAVGISVA
jgi:hypothetical protein